MRNHFSFLKAGAAATAIALAMPATSYAFDDVDWDWTKRVNERVTINADINADIDLEGMVEIEKFQFQWGDVTATASVNNFQNEADRDLADDGGFVIVDVPVNGQFSDTITYNDVIDGTETANNPFTNLPDDLTQVAGDPGIDAIVTAGTVDEQDDEIDIDLTVEGTAQVEVDISDLETDPLDAADLPRIENAATAVGNNQLVESTSALFLHDGQFVIGSAGGVNGEFDGGFVEDAAGALAFISGEDGNEHNELAGLLILGGLAGAFQPAQITATATVGGDPCEAGCDGDALASILNASVDNAATAVANNVSVNLDGADAASNTMIADLTQFAYADVSATATVNDVLLDGYEGFGAAGLGGADPTPIISNVATAVGNNVSISVGVPDVDVE